MRIYINNLNIDIADDIQEMLKEHLCHSEIFVKVFTDEGIYKIYNNKTLHLNVVDKDIKLYKNYYNNLTLISDSSYFREEPVFSIHGTGEHVAFEIQQLQYKLNKKSKCIFVIEHAVNKTGKPVPMDIYCMTEEDVDLDDLVIKEELIEFLSMLN